MLSVFSKVSIKQKTKQDLGGPGAVVFLTIATFLISQFLAVIVAGLLFVAANHLIPGHSWSDSSVPGQFLYILVAEAAAVWMVIRLVRLRGLKLEFIGLGRKPVRADLWQAIITFFVYYAALFVVAVILKVLLPHFDTNQSQNLGFQHLDTGFYKALAFLSLVILPPLGEEVLVRGYLYSGLKARLMVLPAALITSLLFAIAHLEFGSGSPLVWGAAIQTFVLSLVLVRLREKTGALYSGMVLHFMNNIIAFFVIYH